MKYYHNSTKHYTKPDYLMPVVGLRGSGFFICKIHIMKKWYSIHYASLPLGSNIESIEPDDFNDLIQIVNYIMLNKKHDRVYLYSYGGLENPIIISCNPFHIRHKLMENFAFREHHIHEYESYEDAYEVAKDMMEEHPLRFNKK